MTPTGFDSVAWDGDYDDLPAVEELEFDPKLCERTFSSKHQAFFVGLYCGAARAGDEPS